MEMGVVQAATLEEAEAVGVMELGLTNAGRLTLAAC